MKINDIRINNTGMKRALLINDLSSLGKCSLSVSMPILSAYDIETVPLPTVLLSAHTGFKNSVREDMSKLIEKYCESWKELGLHFDCIFTGFFADAAQIRLIGNMIREFSDENTIVLVDPVLGDHGEMFSCFDQEYRTELRKLLELADYTTPNLTEAALLTGRNVKDDPSEILKELPVGRAVIKSVEAGGKIGYVYRNGEKVSSLFKEKLPYPVHGTGDVFASSLLGEILSGRSFEEAVREAAAFTDNCIRHTIRRMPGHWYGLSFEDMLEIKKS